MEAAYTIDDIAEELRRAQERDEKGALLIGAGCSVSAGIPVASEVVKEIQRTYQREYERVEKKTYQACMARLTPHQRRELIGRYIDEAKINWAHICIAKLIKEGYVDLILTTNFDPLVVKACALLGVFPSIYDFAASDDYRPSYIATPAVFYLHGQRSGFRLMNTEAEMEEHKKRMVPVFREAAPGRTWLVAGYSGENDPVFEQLAAVESFDHRLFWVGYRNDPPQSHLTKRLLVDGKYAHYVSGGFNPDSFFVQLTERLGCWPPDLVAKPFSHVASTYAMIGEYRLPDQEEVIPVLENARAMVQRAIEEHEGMEGQQTEAEDQDARLTRARTLLMSGDYEAVLALWAEQEERLEALDDLAAWAFTKQGNKLANQAVRKEEAEAEEAEALALFEEAAERYGQAVETKPDMHEALNNWGKALADQARLKQGEEGDELFALAYEKYKRALAVKPDKHETLGNWGNALSDQARRTEGTEADGLFAAAFEKYERAVAMNPDDHAALDNWGGALLYQAHHKRGAERDRVLNEAETQLRKAARLQPDEVYNLACLHILREDVEEGRRLLLKAKDVGTLPPQEHLLSDPDLEVVRDEDWFAELLNGPG